jgi:hypothetical protein
MVYSPVSLEQRATNDPRGPSGTNVFAAPKCSGWYTYTLTNADKHTATVLICVHCRNWQGQRGRQGRQTLFYACWGSGSMTEVFAELLEGLVKAVG